MNISLEEELKLTPDQPCKNTLQVLILDKGSLTKYGDNKCFGNVMIADGTKLANATLYDLAIFSMMVRDMGVLIQDFIPKKK